MDRYPPDAAPPIVRDSLREVIANDEYAATFQSLGQYRGSLLKHINNLRAAEQAAACRARPGPVNQELATLAAQP